VIDDRNVLARLADISSPASEVFIRENFDQLSFSERSCVGRRSGILGTMFPAAMDDARCRLREVARESGPSALGTRSRAAPRCWS